MSVSVGRPSSSSGNDIVEALREIKEALEAAPEGVVKMLTVAVDDQGETMTSSSYPSMPWIKITIFNDGPDPVYPTVNDDTAQTETALSAGEQMIADLKKANIAKVILVCDSGESASVRLEATK